MKVLFGKFRRLAYGALALAVLAAVGLPALSGTVGAAGQATARNIELSNATPGATGVTYTVSFKPTSTATVGGIVVDFCGDSPIIGSTTCTLPSNFTLGTSVTIANMAGFTVNTGWSAGSSLQGAAAASNKQVAVLTNATPATPTGTSTAITFDITGVTNPSSTGAFYARIYTFDTSANTTTNYTASGTTRAATFGGNLDYGGAALSTSDAVNVSATVQEQLTFCVSAAAPTSGCSGTSTPTVTLGTGTPKVLTTAAVAGQTGTAYHQITTNAVNGVIVRLKVTSSTTCAGLSRDGGTTCPIAENGAFATIAAGAGKFGLNVSNGSGGTGTVTADSDYGTTAGSYGMAAATYGTYGDPISSTTGAVTDVNSTLTYGASAAATTPAGVYTTTESLIATGTF